MKQPGGDAATGLSTFVQSHIPWAIIYQPGC